MFSYPWSFTLASSLSEVFTSMMKLHNSKEVFSAENQHILCQLVSMLQQTGFCFFFLFYYLTILESCSTSANALRMSLSKSIAFCQALWATVTSPSHPGPPHFFFPSSVRQLRPPHSDSAQEAPGAVPHVCRDTGVKGSSHCLISIARLHGGWSRTLFYHKISE